MTVGSKEHYDVMAFFERTHGRGLRLDKEDKSMWSKGHVYQNGDANRLFKAFLAGYAYGVAVSRD